MSSAAQAAAALRPLAGLAAADLFAAGLVIFAVVALPVLMATTVHVVGAQSGWRRGLSRGAGSARGFYAVPTASAALALAAALAGVPVIGMLEMAGVIGGIGAPVRWCGLGLLCIVTTALRVIPGG